MTSQADRGKLFHLLIADDDPIVRDVLQVRLRDAGYRNIRHASDGMEALRLIREQRVDVLILDLLMPNLSGMDLLRDLSTSPNPLRTIVFCSSVTNRDVIQALQYGARGILTKHSIDELARALDAVLAGRYWVNGQSHESVTHLLESLTSDTIHGSVPARYGLTSRELSVTTLVLEGCSNREIGVRLSITEDTVKRHLTNIFNKVGMSSRLELAMFAVKHGLILRQ